MGRKKCEIWATISTLNTWLVVPDFCGFDFSAYVWWQWKGRGALLVHFLYKLFSLVFCLGAASDLRYWLPHAVCWRQEGQTHVSEESHSQKNIPNTSILDTKCNPCLWFGFAVHVSQLFSTMAYVLPFQNSDLVITCGEPHQGLTRLSGRDIGLFFLQVIILNEG